MRNVLMFLVAAGIVLLSSCAGAPTEVELTSTGQPKYLVTDRAHAYINENEEAVASMKGSDRETPLVCEHVQLPDKSVRVYCYMRGEMERRDLNHQERWRQITFPGARATEGV